MLILVWKIPLRSYSCSRESTVGCRKHNKCTNYCNRENWKQCALRILIHSCWNREPCASLRPVAQPICFCSINSLPLCIGPSQINNAMHSSKDKPLSCSGVYTHTNEHTSSNLTQQRKKPNLFIKPSATSHPCCNQSQQYAGRCQKIDCFSSAFDFSHAWN